MKPSDPSAPAPAAAAPSAASAPFFAVSLPKLAIMSIFSFGLYQVYWFYRNCQLIEKREGRDFALMARALFSVFFCYRLFARVATAGAAADAGHLRAGMLAAIYVVTSVFWLASDWGLIIANLGVLPLLAVQRVANRVNANQAPGHDPNRRYSVWNVAIMVLGLLVQAASVAYWKWALSV